MEHILLLLLLLRLVLCVPAAASVPFEDFTVQPVCQDTVTAHPRVDLLEGVSIVRCAERCLSSRFCLSFYYRRSTRTCILNAFRLPPGVNPADATAAPGFKLYSSKYKVVAYPSTCEELQTQLNINTDGDYWLYLRSPTMLGNRAKVYCHRMSSTSPQHYISLVNLNIGNYPGQAKRGCQDATTLSGPATPGVTGFSKIRIFPENMLVERKDYKFALSTTDNINMYGQAADCYNEYNGPQSCGPVGTFLMDTGQTGLIIDPQLAWSEFAYKPYPPKVTRSQGGVVINLLCGGYCGGCAPAPSSKREMFLYYNPNERLADIEAYPPDITSGTT